MEYDEMLSWLLFYTSIFNLEKMPEAAVADPAGLVGSRVVETADGAVRFTLNGSRSHRTLSGRFLNAFFGSGVQHVAFATSDILHTAATLRGNGVKLLPIPANYYDDLEARFGLAGNLLDEMKAAGVLYDRDDGGEYLQLYTVPFADRFFFEIVERRGGYRGFGAPNAPIRLAAQARLNKPSMAELP
jgi:4-hydroxyphenylpyruvate dioxygenase